LSEFNRAIQPKHRKEWEMKAKRIHLEKAIGKGISECGKTGIDLAFREGASFYTLAGIEKIKSDCICSICLKINSPAIHALVIAKRKPIEFIGPPKPIATKPAKQVKSNPKPKSNSKSKPIAPACMVHPKMDCHNCGDCSPQDAEPIAPKPIQKPRCPLRSKPRKPIAPVVEKKKERKPIPPKVKESIQQTAKQLIDAIIPPIPKSSKGKVRELRQAKQLKVVAPPIEAQFAKPDTTEVIELKDSQIVSSELAERIKSNYVCRHLGIGNQNLWGVIKRISDTKSELICGPIEYQRAFAIMSQHMTEDINRELGKAGK
jgi:hypothetical protein